MALNIPIDLNEPPYDVEDATPRPLENIIIELNVDDSPKIRYPVIEFDLDQFFKDDDEVRSDSSRFSMNLTVEMVKQGKQAKNRILTDVERWTIYHALLEKSVNGKLKKNTTKEVNDFFNIELRKVQRIWKIHKRTSPGSDVDVSSRKARNCGRQRIEADFSVLRRHSSAIKPHLKDENKSQLEFCLSMLDESAMLNEPKFKGMYNYVHIHEKWFYLTKKEQTYYLLDNEEDPHRSCQSKNNIAKVVFLAATAHPRFDGEGRVRNSRNKQAGTMEMKAITYVKRDNVKAFLIEKVIPSIIEKWPSSDYGETIDVQQDNARTFFLMTLIL
ncbi:transposon protein [Striga asiatica]|uniref:Transposon protein n=1 Tax=Striga asiatica TaxID=4170 RepID=A0A5A7PGG0_STRAF|nr:transposon protein [Striga asiatica]